MAVDRLAYGVHIYIYIHILCTQPARPGVTLSNIYEIWLCGNLCGSRNQPTEHVCAAPFRIGQVNNQCKCAHNTTCGAGTERSRNRHVTRTGAAGWHRKCAPAKVIKRNAHKHTGQDEHIYSTRRKGEKRERKQKERSMKRVIMVFVTRYPVNRLHGETTVAPSPLRLRGRLLHVNCITIYLT